MSADAPSVPDSRALADEAVALVREWLTRAADGRKHRDGAADRLATVLQDPHGLEFTVGFVDRVVRTEDVRAAARALRAVAEIVPRTMPAADRAQIRAGAAMASTAPQVVVPAARARLRRLVGHMIVDARPKPFGQAVRKLTAQGHRLNINLLGEEVLGQEEADKHLADAAALLDRDDVDYVSLKVSSVVPQLSHWGFEGTVAAVVERLLPVYRAAAQAPAGSKFINLDMEVYSDLHLTTEVFTRLLERPELRGLEAGIVVQAYLPDALAVVRRLSAWSAERVAAGGAGIKVRLVKGANLPMERVDAELHGWPLATWDTKQGTDTNYKRVLDWVFRPERMTGLRLGVAGHNLFDIAFAHLLAQRRGVTERIEFEMLQGMAVEQARAVSADVGELLLYVPAVRPAEFDVAVSYLVRRLEENASHENFMSGIFDLAPDNEVFAREERRFRAALEALDPRQDTDPVPARAQDRSAPGAGSAHLPLDEAFRNEPDTDVAVPANQAWAEDIAARITDRRWYEELPVPGPVDAPDVERLVATGRAAAEDWHGRGARERAEILNRAADVLAARRGHLLAVAGAEAGKTLGQSDPEVSEAVDFCRWYARRALELEAVDGARFVPDRLVLVTPPWNFPLAIPTGSTVAALAAGAAVLHKPAPEVRRCSTAVVEALWEAGVPRDVLQLVDSVEGEVGQALVSHPGVDRIVLTGAYETAQLFGSWRPGRPLTAETSGKNAMVITPSADRDRAVWDLVTSAFGHAGQKCSAASLGILVGSVARSPRFRRQLLDAASSMVVDWPQNLQATVGPTIDEPGGKLRRALTRLDPGEEWLLEPRQLDDTGRLWRPGIKTGVAPGSFYHRTECFGPVLGLMEASDLYEALELQNAVDYGLTAGLHSLDPEEISTWVDLVEAGNLYVNRGITGAIVQRQPFGGWKRSSVGLGAKAGGPNYLVQLGSWQKAPFAQDPAGQSDIAAHPAAPIAHHLEALRPLVPEADAAWLTACAEQDQAWWEREFGRVHDATGLACEANLFRYRPRDVVVRAAEDAPLTDVIRVGLAAVRSCSRVILVPAAEVPGEVRELFRSVLDPCGDEAFARVAADWSDPSGSGRIRVVGTAHGLAEALAGRPEIDVLADPVVGASRVEMLPMLAEQAVAVTMHRFGNPSADAETVVRRLVTASQPAEAPAQPADI
ncbi:proline dehydrogenase family protein [Kocuria sp. SM24M-10]|uniref:proline dehydrogenase family protein n=1 Tax=Kocuria sp. SM24M-10 TaxID=1660349 RepID=UPI00064AA846|nr:proline dehydrogenase family protein [Kocuria sp. SM24M-10]KLU10307.1 aldehyde dehydrogenase [Kocuria sp. SM24M-10]